MTEEWRPVVGVEGYEVSSLGRVKSVKRRQPRLLSLIPQSYGYLQVGLRDGESKAITRRVHALVAAAFLGPRPDGMEVRHLDGDPTNNTLSNLAYGTHGDNMLDQVGHGTHFNARKTHCSGGHEYTEANTRTTRGRRECRTCRREWNRRNQGVAA